MPYLNISTSNAIDAAPRQKLLAAASQLVAAELGKPEQFMMVALHPALPLLFAGSAAPCAFVELRGIGLPEAKTAKLAQMLCQLLENELGIRRDRVYINFAAVPAHLWGWNGETF